MGQGSSSSSSPISGAAASTVSEAPEMGALRDPDNASFFGAVGSPSITPAPADDEKLRHRPKPHAASVQRSRTAAGQMQHNTRHSTSNEMQGISQHSEDGQAMDDDEEMRDLSLGQRHSLEVQGSHPYRVDPASIQPARQPLSRLNEPARLGMMELSNSSPYPPSNHNGRDRSPSPRSIPVAGDFESTVGQVNLLKDEVQGLKLRNNELEQLCGSLEHKRYQDYQEYRKLDGLNSSLRHQLEDTKNMYTKKSVDYDNMSRNYMDLVRTIKVTDDDHSTIIDKLNKLRTSIDNLVRKLQGVKSANLDRTAAIKLLKSRGLLEKFPVEEQHLEPFQLNLFIESIIMKRLQDQFFDAPISSAFDHNDEFLQLYNWMYRKNPAAAVRWRQQIGAMLVADPEMSAQKKKKVDMATQDLLSLVKSIYPNVNEPPSKLSEVCDKAFDLALAMMGQSTSLSTVDVPLNTPFDEELMCPSVKSNPDGAVALVIFPGFQDPQGYRVIKPKEDEFEDNRRKEHRVPMSGLLRESLYKVKASWAELILEMARDQ
ncbi:hypothetical protein BGW38_004982, partial [Lunasporangiospora selenospora]